VQSWFHGWVTPGAALPEDLQDKLLARIKADLLSEAGNLKLPVSCRC
jgi:hypothetical protein